MGKSFQTSVQTSVRALNESNMFTLLAASSRPLPTLPIGSHRVSEHVVEVRLNVTVSRLENVPISFNKRSFNEQPVQLHLWQARLLPVATPSATPKSPLRVLLPLRLTREQRPTLTPDQVGPTIRVRPGDVLRILLDNQVSGKRVCRVRWHVGTSAMAYQPLSGIARSRPHPLASSLPAYPTPSRYQPTLCPNPSHPIPLSHPFQSACSWGRRALPSGECFSGIGRATTKLETTRMTLTCTPTQTSPTSTCTGCISHRWGLRTT